MPVPREVHAPVQSEIPAPVHLPIEQPDIIVTSDGKGPAAEVGIRAPFKYLLYD